MSNTCPNFRARSSFPNVRTMQLLRSRILASVRAAGTALSSQRRDGICDAVTGCGCISVPGERPWPSNDGVSLGICCYFYGTQSKGFRKTRSVLNPSVSNNCAASTCWHLDFPFQTIAKMCVGWSFRPPQTRHCSQDRALSKCRRRRFAPNATASVGR